MQVYRPRCHRIVPSLCAGLTLALAFSSAAQAQEPRSYRITRLALRDPQVFIDPFQTGTACANITNTPLFGISVNNLINEFLTECNPVSEGQAEPCNLDFNLVATLDPLIQTPGACTSGGQPCTARLELLPNCIKNGTSVDCSGTPDVAVDTTYTNSAAGQTCLTPHSGTSGANNTTPYSPAIVNPMGPCLVSGEVDFTFEFGDDVVIPIPLRGLQVAAMYVGDPATKLMTGLARGFLPESAADATVISVNDPITLNIRLAEALAGGADKCYGGENDGMPCTNPQSTTQCPGGLCRQSCAPSASNHAQDDRDFNPPGDTGGERGWWFYLEFEAEPVTVPEAPTPTATLTATETETPLPTDTPTPLDTPTDTPTTGPTLTPTETSTPLPTETPTPRPPCPGDCDASTVVAIGEVQIAANIYLEEQPLSACPLADVNGDGSVAINEIVLSALSFKRGCP